MNMMRNLATGEVLFTWINLFDAGNCDENDLQQMKSLNLVSHKVKLLQENDKD